MSTRSSIAVEHESGRVDAVYCHFDGYVDGVGKALVTQHNGRSEAAALVGLGDLSTVAGSEGVRAYHRDRGEKWDDVKPKEYANKADYQARVGSEIGDNGYRYIYTGGAWWVWDDGQEPKRVEALLAAKALTPDEIGKRVDSIRQMAYDPERARTEESRLRDGGASGHCGRRRRPGRARQGGAGVGHRRVPALDGVAHPVVEVEGVHMASDWTKEKRDRIVTTLRHQASCAESDRYDLLADDLRDAADELETKPSESSMVQRIEAPKSSEQSLMEENERLRTALMKIRGAATRPTFARAACEGIVLVVNLALDGPPDPERDREPRAEVERP